MVVSGAGDPNQVHGRPYAPDINYNMVSLVPTENVVPDSKQPIRRQITTLGSTMDLLQKNYASLS